MASRRRSSLVALEKISPNRTSPRTNAICRLTPHCVGGNLTPEAILGLSNFQKYDPNNGASCTYAIGSTGRTVLGVPETDRPWTTGSGKNDHQAITFEIANNGGAPDWRMSDAALNAWVNLAVEVARFYGFKKVSYMDKPSHIPRGEAATEAWIKTWAPSDAMIITLHRWYGNKECPGNYFVGKLPELVKRINATLAGAETSVPTPVAAKSSLVRVAVSALNVRKGPGTNYPVVKVLRNDPNTYTIVEEATGIGAAKWGKLKSGIGWIALNHTKPV